MPDAQKVQIQVSESRFLPYTYHLTQNKELWRRDTKDHGMSSMKGLKSSSLYLFVLRKKNNNISEKLKINIFEDKSNEKIQTLNRTNALYNQIYLFNKPLNNLNILFLDSSVLIRVALKKAVEDSNVLV